jgi:hypothetical protein
MKRKIKELKSLNAPSSYGRMGGIRGSTAPSHLLVSNPNKKEGGVPPHPPPHVSLTSHVVHWKIKMQTFLMMSN